jgi:hypothetical protein
LTKCQYFLAERASEARLPTISAYVLLAESNPKHTLTLSGIWKSLSTVLGTATTLVGTFVAAKCSARYAALVAESSPPTMTSPSSFRSRHVLAAAAKCSGVCRRNRPVPRRWNPPWFRSGFRVSEVTSVQRLRTSPSAPPRKPMSAGSPFARENLRARQSNMPAATLWPPAAGPPLKSRPRRAAPPGPGPRTGLERVSGEGAAEASVTLKVGVDAVLGNTSGSARRIKRPPRSPTSSDARRACSANVGAGSSAATSSATSSSLNVNCNSSPAKHRARAGSYAKRCLARGERSSMDFGGGRRDASERRYARRDARRGGAR